uniref:Na+/H+ antiporter NhaC-like C-terminal domain-containing protein n=1 Tax=Ectopseudomonas oleovorans TaxID=301 RepID=A0A653AXV7_ECTOL
MAGLNDHRRAGRLRDLLRVRRGALERGGWAVHRGHEDDGHDRLHHDCRSRVRRSDEDHGRGQDAGGRGGDADRPQQGGRRAADAAGGVAGDHGHRLLVLDHPDHRRDLRAAGRAAGVQPAGHRQHRRHGGGAGDAGSPASDSTLGPTSGLNADGQHNHIWDSVVPTFLHYNLPLLVFGWAAAMLL